MTPNEYNITPVIKDKYQNFRYTSSCEIIEVKQGGAMVVLQSYPSLAIGVTSVGS